MFKLQSNTFMWEQINGTRSKTRYRGVSAAGERLQTCLKRTKIMYVDLQHFRFRYLPLLSTLMEIPQGTPWKIAENRTLKWGSSPPRAEIHTFKLFILNNLHSKILEQIQNLDPHRLMSD